MMSSSPRKMFVLLCCFFLIENQKADHPHFRLTAFILIGDHATVGPWEHHGHERIHAGNRNGMVKPPELWLFSYTLASQVLFEQRGSQSELCYVPHNTVTANARGIFFFFFSHSYTTLRRWRVAVVCLERSSSSWSASQCLLPLSVRLAMAEIVWSRFAFPCHTAYRGHLSKSIEWECEEGTGW